MQMSFIVEGFHDEDVLKSLFPSCTCLVLQRPLSRKRIWDEVVSLSLSHPDTLILTDPDEEGDRLAQRVWAVAPHLVRVPIPVEEATCFRGRKKKIGVEHCEPERLKAFILPFLLHPR